MKFIICVVMLALATANAGVIYQSPLAYTSIAGPYGIQFAHAPHISLAQGIGAPLALPYSAYPYATYPAALPAALPAAIPAPVPLTTGSLATHASLVAGPSASYVASTRGATHVAPLPGHVQSVSSQNLEAAPGTL